MIKFGSRRGPIFCLATDRSIYALNVSEIGNNCKFPVFVPICFPTFNGILALNIMRKGLFCEG
ncbi:hypothetical protein IX84_21185 [Phaeodactylibacter xiamenensis]|uniref:Uncharacterized protein n=1 Tax=Phaeodactylibacter xiamenensis TaxID=1524460 RepID=A0A098S2R9_9BACT|nr:hypothetical protein IX84_21185 [Phaeodactylibacter xiamenensis]